MNVLMRWSLALGMLLASGCGPGGELGQAGLPAGSRSCTLSTCFSGANFEGPVVLPADPTKLEVQLCFNGQCETTQVRQADRSGRAFDCSSQAQPMCWLWLDPGAPTATLWGVIEPPAGVDLTDGDSYQLTVAEPDSTPILSASANAPYKQSRPNGPGCLPICDYVLLTWSL